MPATALTLAQVRQRLARSGSLEPHEKPLNAAPEAGQRIAHRFGEGALDAMAAIGVRFGD